jgi:hypothetical protein
MNTTIAIRKVPIAIAFLLAAGWTAGACTTTAVSSAPDAGGDASGSGSGGGSGSGSGSSSGGIAPGDASSTPDGPTVTTICGVPPSPDGGFAPIIDFSTICPGDAGAALGCFGAYPAFYGGTYTFASTTDQLPNPDAGLYCAVYGSQSTFSTIIDTATKSWDWSGTVAGYSGGGLYIGPCANASSYSGIQFSISGTLGITAGDAGASTQVQLQVSQLEDWATASAGGTCLSADGGPGTGCSPAVYSFDLPATPTEIQVPWASLTGEAPDTIFDQAHIIQIQGQLPWPCTGGTPYSANVSIQAVQFYK